MSLSRSVVPFTLSYSFSRFSTNAAATSVRRKYAIKAPLCLSCRVNQVVKRSLSTVTEYRPHALDPAPPPPRNADIPETSITGIPELGNGKPPMPSVQNGAFPASLQAERQSASETEGEAQKSKPVTEPAKVPTSAPKPQRPSRLRARKAAMVLTPTAISQLRNLLSQPEPKLIRVGVKNRGCSGLAYHLEYVDQSGKFDEAVEQDGVKVLIDSKALFSIIGSEMDWVEDKLSQRFVFRNPNIKEQCGCGESFMV